MKDFLNTIPFILLLTLLLLVVFITNAAIVTDKNTKKVYETYKYYITCRGSNDYTNDYNIDNGVCRFIGRNSGKRVVTNFSVDEVNCQFVKEFINTGEYTSWFDAIFIWIGSKFLADIKQGEE